MRILLLSDLESYGGAALAASRLAAGLAELGVAVQRAVYSRQSADPGVLVFATRAIKRQLDGGRMHTRPAERQMLERLLQIVRRRRIDLINVHNLHMAGLTPWLVGELAARLPVVWTLHDQWAFTGSCAFSYGCEQFVVGCSSRCPQAGAYPTLEPDRIPDAWRLRQQVCRQGAGILWVTPSRWLSAVARRGLLAGQQVEVIPNGLDPRRYRPGDQAAARAALGLPADGPVLLVLSTCQQETRKGLHLAAEIVGRLSTRPFVLAVGHRPARDPWYAGFPHKATGYLEDAQAVVECFNAADLLLYPTLADNLPNVLIEATACGLPAVSCLTGGVPEIVEPGRTGYLADRAEPDELARLVDRFFALPQRARSAMRRRCRDLALSCFDVRLQATRYQSLFENLLQQRAVVSGMA